MAITFLDLIEVWGRPFSPRQFDMAQPLGEVSTDSRSVNQGSFFVPLVGARFDGHDFLSDAVKNGAKAAFISTDYKGMVPEGLCYWKVSNTLMAYQELARLHRIDLGLCVIAVTGSVGKTTTRELIRSALQPFGKISSSIENNNNDIGVPYTLFCANKSHSAVIVEMGMRGLGEIQRLSQCARPDIAVITNIGSAHLEFLGSRENIATAKCEIVTSLSQGGLVVIPSGDSLLEAALAKVWSGRIVRVAVDRSNFCITEVTTKDIALKENNADFSGVVDQNISSLTLNGENFKLPLEGFHNAKNLMLAIAVANELKVPMNKLKELKVEIPSGRNTSLEFGAVNIMDESYNSSPEAMKASLEVLISKPGSHFAVIGTMKELGKESIKWHREIGETALKLGLDGMVIVSEGLEAQALAAGANGLMRLRVVNTTEEALNPLLAWVKSGDTILIKGSRAIKLERLLPLLKDAFNH